MNGPTSYKQTTHQKSHPPYFGRHAEQYYNIQHSRRRKKKKKKHILKQNVKTINESYPNNPTRHSNRIEKTAVLLQ